MIDIFLNKYDIEELIKIRRILLAIFITGLMLFSFILGEISGEINQTEITTKTMNLSANSLEHYIHSDCADFRYLPFTNCIKGDYYIANYNFSYINSVIP